MLETFFLNHLGLSAWLLYLLIFILMLFEGEIVIFITIFLVHQHLLRADYAIPILVGGLLLGDTLWYRFGYYLEKIIPCWHRWMNKAAVLIDDNLLAHPYLTMIISKFTYGFHRPTLMRCGGLKIPYKRFIKIDLLAAIIWFGAISAVALITSSSIGPFNGHFRSYLKQVEYALFIGVGSIIVITHVITLITKKKLKTNLK